MLALGAGVTVLLVLFITFPMLLMGAAMYLGPRAIPWARRRAEKKRRRRHARRHDAP